MTATTKAVAGGKTSKLRFHHGMALKRIAEMYPTLVDMLLEEVQNAVDAGATRISVSVNQKTGSITINDNGEGVTIEKFEQALQSICVSIKEAGKFGRFGIGLISPLGKCRKFRFTSCPAERGGVYREWEFVSDEICNKEIIEGIPYRERRDLVFRQEGASQGVPWRTSVQIEGFTSDRVVSKISPESLGVSIVDRYGVVMRRNKVAVSIDLVEKDGTRHSKEIKATQWSGTELPEVRISEKDAGETIFRLYQARRTAHGRKGRVLIGEANDDFRIDFKTFAAGAQSWLSNEAVEILNSGIFEGEILSSKAKLHASRRSFDTDIALVGLCSAVDEWYKHHGRALHKKISNDRRDERHQQLALRSLKVLEALFRNPESEFLRDLFKRARVGSVGPGHAEVPDRKVIGPEDAKSLAVQGQHKDGKGQGKASGSPEKENPDHHPVTVTGPSGKQRTAVRSNSLGLRIAHDQIKGFDQLWTFDPATGTLFFNTLHPAWARCEGRDGDLMRLQETVAIQALVLQVMPEEMKVSAELYQQQLVWPTVFLIKEGDKLAGRQKF